MGSHEVVKLPTVCVGALASAAEPAPQCDRAPTFLLSSVLADNRGRPMPVLVGACRWHQRDAKVWLQNQGDDSVDVWPMPKPGDRVARLLADSGIDWHTLMRVAS